MTGDEALDALRAAQDTEARLRDIGNALAENGLTADVVRTFLRQLREQRWRACEPDCEETHEHRVERRVEVDTGVSVDWEILDAFNDEQERHCSPGSHRTSQGKPASRPLPSMMRELAEQIVIIPVDAIGIAPDGLGLRKSAPTGAHDELAA